MTKAQWTQLEAAARRRAVTLAGVAQASLVADVQAELAKALEQGTTLEDFKAGIGQRLEAAWGGTVKNPAARLETIFRTTTQSALNAGRHAQACDPDTLKVRPFWQFDAVLDDRTTPVCKACNGHVVPADSTWWQSHLPPLHFNAVDAATLVVTSRGQVAAEDVHPGEMVLTHRTRWRPVYAVLHKIERATVRELHLSTGRVLRVTDEHPVLVDAPVDGLVWRHARDIKRGDHVFEHCNEVRGSCEMAVRCPDDAPALKDEPAVAHEVVGLPVRGVVDLAVQLQVNPRVDERQVEGVPAYHVLHHGTGEQLGGATLRWSEVLAVPAGDGGRCLLSTTRPMHRVVGPHGLDPVAPSEAPGPMPLAAPTRHDLGQPVADRDLLGAGTHRDAEALAPSGDDTVSRVQRALDGSKALSLAPVSVSDESFDVGPLGQSHWHVSTVITIVDSASEERHLCDLSVVDDETYVAGGVLVHNCRSTFHPLTRRQAERLGVTTEPPAHAPDEGFGAPPAPHEAPVPSAP
jgi:hypothetical protein